MSGLCARIKCAMKWRRHVVPQQDRSLRVRAGCSVPS